MVKFEVGKIYEINTHENHLIPEYAKNYVGLGAWRQHTIFKVTKIDFGRIHRVIILTDSSLDRDTDDDAYFALDSYMALNSKEIKFETDEI